MRVQVEYRPRMASISTSEGWRWVAAAACRAFQRSSPASASSFFLARPISISGLEGARRREGWTRAGSPGALRYCGGQGASPSPAFSCRADSSGRVYSVDIDRMPYYGRYR